jgi:hypothetical protein
VLLLDVFLNNLAVRVLSNVPEETSLKINKAEGQPGQPFEVFQISRLLQIIHLFPTYDFFFNQTSSKLDKEISVGRRNEMSCHLKNTS